LPDIGFDHLRLMAERRGGFKHMMRSRAGFVGRAGDPGEAFADVPSHRPWHRLGNVLQSSCRA